MLTEVQNDAKFKLHRTLNFDPKTDRSPHRIMSNSHNIITVCQDSKDDREIM